MPTLRDAFTVLSLTGAFIRMSVLLLSFLHFPLLFYNQCISVYKLRISPVVMWPPYTIAAREVGLLIRASH